MHKLLSADLWQIIADLSREHDQLHAAIAYVTTEDYLDFRKGDVLVCDASEESIKAGMTCAKVLKRFYKQGAAIYSFAGLHAKILVSNNKAVIGSANLSKNAGMKTTEAALLTDDQRICALAQGFIEEARRKAQLVDKPFLDRIEKIPVVRRGGHPARKPKLIDTIESRLWLISTCPREKTPPDEEAAETRGKAKAKKKLRRGDYEPCPCRFVGKNRFRRYAKPGHLVIEVYREKRGSRTFTEVYRPVRILHREEAEKSTFFYFDVPSNQKSFCRWSKLSAELRRLGCKNVTPNSIRELTGQSERVHEWFSRS